MIYNQLGSMFFYAILLLAISTGYAKSTSDDYYEMYHPEMFKIYKKFIVSSAPSKDILPLAFVGDCYYQNRQPVYNEFKKDGAIGILETLDDKTYFAGNFTFWNSGAEQKPDWDISIARLHYHDIDWLNKPSLFYADNSLMIDYFSGSNRFIYQFRSSLSDTKTLYLRAYNPLGFFMCELELK